MPFKFDSIIVSNNHNELRPNSTNNNMKYDVDDVIFSFEYSGKNCCIGINLEANKLKEKKDMDIIFNILFENKDYKPNLDIAISTSED